MGKGCKLVVPAQSILTILLGRAAHAATSPWLLQCVITGENRAPFGCCYPFLALPRSWGFAQSQGSKGPFLLDLTNTAVRCWGSVTLLPTHLQPTAEVFPSLALDPWPVPSSVQPHSEPGLFFPDWEAAQLLKKGCASSSQCQVPSPCSRQQPLHICWF